MLTRAAAALAFASLALLAGGCNGHSQLLLASPRKRCLDAHPHRETLRVATYNIKAGKLSSLQRVLATLRELDADVISLQEVEVGRDEERPVDQARWLAERLGMEVAFAGARRAGEGHFGVALLSRLPILDVKRVPLAARFSLEPRVALDAELCAGDRPLRVLAVHSDVFGWSARANASALAALTKGSLGKGVLVAGDLNAAPMTEALAPLFSAGLNDVVGERAEGITFPGVLAKRLDYLFVDQPLKAAVRSVRIFKSEASDHYPVVAELDLAAWLSRAAR